MAELLPVKVTVPAFGVNVPPLFVQLPAIEVFAPAVYVPAVNVKTPLTVIVAGAVKFPVVSVKLFTVREVVLPPTFNNCPAVLLTITLLKVWATTVPFKEALFPVKVTVPVPAVNVPPLLVQLPAMPIAKLLALVDKVAPEAMVKFPFMVRPTPIVVVPALIIRLLKVVNIAAGNVLVEFN